MKVRPGDVRPCEGAVVERPLAQRGPRGPARPRCEDAERDELVGGPHPARQEVGAAQRVEHDLQHVDPDGVVEMAPRRASASASSAHASQRPPEGGASPRPTARRRCGRAQAGLPAGNAVSTRCPVRWRPRRRCARCASSTARSPSPRAARGPRQLPRRAPEPTRPPSTAAPMPPRPGRTDAALCPTPPAAARARRRRRAGRRSATRRRTPARPPRPPTHRLWWRRGRPAPRTSMRSARAEPGQPVVLGEHRRVLVEPADAASLDGLGGSGVHPPAGQRREVGVDRVADRGHGRSGCGRPRSLHPRRQTRREGGVQGLVEPLRIVLPGLEQVEVDAAARGRRMRRSRR